MSTGPTSRGREDLLTAMDREGRRLGFHSTMHNHACAALVGLHPTDWEILDVLGWAGAVSAGELAGHLGMSNGAITGALDRLERGDFVRRIRDTADRRRVLVEAIHNRDDQIPAKFKDLNRAMIEANARFSDEELELILRFMRGASAALEDSTRRVRAAASASASSDASGGADVRKNAT